MYNKIKEENLIIGLKFILKHEQTEQGWGTETFIIRNLSYES